MTKADLKAPFPYFGGKRAVADLVWPRLGNVANYVEPFCGSAAMLLCRPDAPNIETVNDADCYVANFWRATQAEPEAVADWCNHPVNECDLHARHRWLVLSPEAAEFRERMRTDPAHYDAKVAGWWCWGLCCWIGSGWCSVQSAEVSQLPLLADARCRGRGVNSNDDAGTCEERRLWLVDWFSRLRDRLRTVRVCCGHWLRVCDSESVTTRLGITGTFLDPPYSTEAGRDMNLYVVDCGKVAHEVRAWCLERGPNPQMRIVLAGYAGEGHEELETAGWDVLAWKSQGGYGNRSEKGRANAAKERLWFSPHCVQEQLLF
jgi:DNA adenine methylase